MFCDLSGVSLIHLNNKNNLWLSVKWPVRQRKEPKSTLWINNWNRLYCIIWDVHSLCNLCTSSVTVLVGQKNLYKLCTTVFATCTCMKQAHKACVACTCKQRYLSSLYGLVLVLVLVYTRYRRSPWLGRPCNRHRGRLSLYASCRAGCAIFFRVNWWNNKLN